MTDRVKCLCSYCRKPFSERASRLKNGYQVQCPNCMRLITFDTSSEDANISTPPKGCARKQTGGRSRNSDGEDTKAPKRE